MGLILQIAGRCRQLFDHGRILLSRLIHIGDNLPDLGNPEACSALAALISPMMSVTRLML